MTAATITTYQWYLAIHILAAVVWVGGALTLQLFAIRASRAEDPQRLAAFADDAAFVGTRFFMPASLVLVVMGFLLIHEGNWDYQFWIVFPIIVWVASFISGAGFLGPQSSRLHTVLARDGAGSAEATAIQQRIFLVSRIELVLLLLVVLDMALKPGS